LYHKEQSLYIERMSIFWVIFVIFLIFAAPPPKQELDDIFEEWETDNRPDNRSNASNRPHKIGRQTKDIHRFNLNELG